MTCSSRFHARLPGSALVVGLWLLGGLAAAQQARPQTASCKAQALDRVMSVIEGKDSGKEGSTIILRSDLILAARVDAIRVFGKEGMTSEITDEILSRVLREEEGSQIIYKEAMKYDVVAVREEDILRVRDELAARIGGPAELEKWLQAIGVSAETLRSYLHRQLVVEGFINFKKSEAAPLDDAELNRIYESGEHPYVDRPFDEIKEKLRSYEQARRTTAAIQAWKKELRSGYRVIRMEDAGGAKGP